MKDINKVILIGRLGADPEVRKTTDGRVFTCFSLATSRRKKVKNDDLKNESALAEEQWVYDTQWHKVVCWGSLAQICLDFFKKGHTAYVEGYLRSFTLESEKGDKKHFYEIVAENLSHLEKRAPRSDSENAVQDVEAVVL